MAKRKRTEAPSNEVPITETNAPKKSKSSAGAAAAATKESTTPLTIQVVAGSYDRVLHGITVTIGAKGDAEFADSFLFGAHLSAIRCLAISPPSAPAPGQRQKVLLASGSTDERINVYNLSAHAPSRRDEKLLATVGPRPILEDPKNRELGTLLHHTSSVARLAFPTRSKLLSCGEDSSIAVTRTRDWNLLSTIKTPIPKPQGRPSGDTAPFGGTPAGVNDFAIDPSMKVMISVSKGERCMRLWNLVTGKKAGVLNFGRETLAEIGEGKHASGEGRRVVWGSTPDGDEFCVGFDRDIVVYDMAAVPKCRVLGSIRTKVHQFSYVVVDDETEATVLAVSTEDGRVLFYSTTTEDLVGPEANGSEKTRAMPTAKLLGQIGGKEEGVSMRIKDFAVVDNSQGGTRRVFIIGGSSDGKVRVWKLELDKLRRGSKQRPQQVGRLLGTYETQNRITCLVAFAMIPRPEGAEDSEDEEEDEGGEAESESDDDEDEDEAEIDGDEAQ